MILKSSKSQNISKVCFQKWSMRVCWNGIVRAHVLQAWGPDLEPLASTYKAKHGCTYQDGEQRRQVGSFWFNERSYFKEVRQRVIEEDIWQPALGFWIYVHTLIFMCLQNTHMEINKEAQMREEWRYQYDTCTKKMD